MGSVKPSQGEAEATASLRKQAPQLAMFGVVAPWI